MADEPFVAPGAGAVHEICHAVVGTGSHVPKWWSRLAKAAGHGV
jgi:hypothetical protein